MCQHCGSKHHLSIHCPLKSPESKPKPWTEQVKAFNAAQAKKPFKCEIKLRPGETSLVCSDNIQDFWKEIHVHYMQSIYRDFQGIRLKGTDDGDIIPPNHPSIEPGHYILVSSTHSWTNEELYNVLQQAVDKLKLQRTACSNAALTHVEETQLLQYNYFSLVHEGNNLSVDEMKDITNKLAANDWKHLAPEDIEGMDESKRHDFQEAVNHILVARQLPDFSKTLLNEELVLGLHSMVMRDLLIEKEEGLAGEYRKVWIGVEGSKTARPRHENVAPLMRKFFEQSLIQQEGEHFIDYMARVHNEFQHVHPFRDGNGRIGRIIMNMLLLRRGYPLLVLPTTLSAMFNHGVGLGTQGDNSLFARLLAEALFASRCLRECTWNSAAT